MIDIKEYEDFYIFKFSICKGISSEYDEVIHDLINLAKEDQECFNMIYPWDDINTLLNNNVFIIVYNKKKNFIQGWANINYSVINNSSNSNVLYTAFIDKIVTRSKPSIKGVGTLILNYIKEKCLNNVYYYNHESSQCEKINIDILYLFSLTSSIPFYKKIDFLERLECSECDDFTKKIYEHSFYYNNTKITEDAIKNFAILWEFENNAVMSDKDIEQYAKFKPNEKCDVPKDENRKIKKFMHDYNV